jgi:hypothetical protein
MPALHLLDRIPEAEWLRARVYAGDLLVVRGSAAARRLVDHFRAVLAQAFTPHDPPTAQFRMGQDEWAERAAALRAEHKRDPAAWQLMRELFAEFGCAAGRTAADAVNLRCQPHATDPTLDPRHTLGVHRDTWASNVYQQINWWLPVHEVDAGRTIAFLPQYWAAAIANDSGDWDLEAVRAEVRAARAGGRSPNIRNVPEPLAEVALEQVLPVVPAPGDVLLFSGAQLHCSVPNGAGATRFSLELRSVDVPDAAAGRGAPNVDGGAPHVAWHWFRCLDSDRALSPEVLCEAGAAG